MTVQNPGVPTVEVDNDSVPVVTVTTGCLNAVPAGGATGQVLSKASGASFDFEWSSAGAGNVIRVSPPSASGDSGGANQVAWDGFFFYVWVDSSTGWLRTALAPF